MHVGNLLALTALRRKRDIFLKWQRALLYATRSVSFQLMTQTIFFLYTQPLTPLSHFQRYLSHVLDAWVVGK
jgi:hypothetical protein